MFYGCSSLTSIDIPAGVTSIGYQAFLGCSSLKSIAIPAGVTSIGEGTFFGCSSLTSIEIPAGVTSLASVTFAEGSGLTSIGSSAFEDCSSLTSIEIPAGVTSIGLYAFYGCSNLDTVYYSGSIENWFNIGFEKSTSNPLYYGADLYIGGELVTAVVVPESVTEIGDYQFYGYTSLTSITIHSGVTSIGDYAFQNCSSLTYVSFAEGSQLTNIGEYAFSGCSSLTSISIPAGVTSIGDAAFQDCSRLTGVSFAEGSRLTTIGDYAFYRCSSLTSIAIPAGVTELPNGYYSNGNYYGVFSGCSNLTGVSFAEGSQLTDIGSYSFYGCSSLTSIAILAGVTSIGGSAFENCSSLTSIDIPAGVTSIGSDAFDGCYLTIVYNYSDLEITAGSYDYGDVAKYAEVVLTEDKLANVKDENGYVTYTDGEEMLLLGYLGSEKDIVIPDGVTRIVDYAFYEDDIVSVTLPGSLTEIGNSAFEYCYTLKEVYNNSALDITAGRYDYGYVARYAAKVYTPENQEAAFDENDFAIDGGVLRGYKGSATNIIIPETVTSIAEYAFAGNDQIISVTIPAGVTSIGEDAFKDCSSLESVTFADGSELASIGDFAFRDCSNLASVNFAEGSLLTSIGDYAFYNCSSLTSIEIPAGVTSIGRSAFYGCDSLISIEIPAGVTELPDGDSNGGVFFGCSNLESVTFAEGSELTSIGSYAFQDCSSLKSIAIPAGLTSIGGSGYNVYNYLDTVYYAGSIEDWFNIEFEYSKSNPLYYGADLYIGGELVTEVVVPESITTIGTQLRGCTSLTSITIHSGITSIGDHAFSGCSSLTGVSFAKGSELTSIGSSAFDYCSSLKSIEIPAGVTSIGDRAFQYCSNLNDVSFAEGSELTSIGSGVFEYCSNLESVTFAEGSQLTSIGERAFQYCSSLTSIEIPAGVTELPNGYDNGRSGVFSGCSSLESVTFADGSQLTSIGSYAFYDCSNLTSIEIPAGVTSIGDFAFNSCSSLASVTFAEGSQLTDIGSLAFSWTSAKNVYISDTGAWCNIEFGDDDSNPLYYGGVLWLNGEIVFELNIPGTVDRIGNYAFRNAERVKNVVIEEGVTGIGDYAFYSMYRLESVTIPSTVTKIGSYTFASNSFKYIYYNGTEKDWLSVEKGSNWDRYCGDYEIIFRPELAEYEVSGEVIESDATENDADNAMIEGATAVLEGENGVFEAVSGVGGAFGFEDVPEGEYTLTVSKEGYITVIKEVFVDSNMFYRIVIDLDAVNTLTGKVSVADDDNDFGNNAPLEGAAVTITRLSSTNAFTYTALTDADGEYSFNGLTIGRYMITVSKDGYRSVTQQFNVYMYQNNIRNIVLEAIPGTNITDGNAAGKIIDSVTGYGVGGLTLDIYKGVNITSGTIIATLTSGENGRYVTPDLTPGNYTIAIRDNRTLSDENERYNDGSIVIKILSDKLIDNQNGYVTNNRQLDVESIRIVLTWGVYPRDLDSHLDIDLSDGTHAHTYYSDKTYYRDGQLMADLDLDDTTSYGPETTTVYVMEEGVYTFYVHDYTNRTSSNSTSLANSGAKVEVYLGNSSVAAYVAYVPDDPGTLWKVFSYDSVTGIITPINGVTYHSSPSSIGQ